MSNVKNPDPRFRSIYPKYLPVSLLYELFEKAISEKVFWGKFLAATQLDFDDNCPDGEVRPTLALFLNFEKNNLGEDHGYDTGDLQMMFRAQAGNELGKLKVYIPTQEEVIEVSEKIICDQEFTDYSLKHLEKIHDDQGRLKSAVRREYMEKIFTQFFKKNHVLTTAISRIVSQRIIENKKLQPKSKSNGSKAL